MSTLVLQNDFPPVPRGSPRIGRAENIPSPPPVLKHNIYWKGSLEDGGSGMLLIIDVDPRLSELEEKELELRAERDFMTSISLIQLTHMTDLWGRRF